MGIYLNDVELAALTSLDPLLRAAYVWLRTKMDRRTRIAGQVTTISRASIAEAMEYEIKKGAGSQWVRLGDTPKQRADAADRIVERLGRAGLISKLGGALLCFLCPLADEGVVRPKQTGGKRATGLSTDRATPEEPESLLCEGGYGNCDVERATSVECLKVPNGRHIKVHGCTPSQSSSTTGCDVPADDDGAAGGLDRDRPSGSQAGSLRRPGMGDEELGRVRASPSHPALSRRSGAGPDGGGAVGNGLEPTGAGSSAAGEWFGDAAERLLRAVLDARGIRVLQAEGAVVGAWVAAGVSPDEVAEAVERARAARLKVGSMQPIPLAYVARVIASQRAAASRAVARIDGSAPRGWRGGVGDLEALARQLGIAGARPGEALPEFRARVVAAWRAGQGENDGT